MMQSQSRLLPWLGCLLLIAPLPVAFGTDSGPAESISSPRPPVKGQFRKGRAKLSFSGNAAIGSKQLARLLISELLAVKIGRRKYDESEIDTDRSRIKEAYHARGYFDVVVTPRVETTNDRDVVVVDFQIQEGEHYKIRKIDITGRSPVPEAILRRGMKLKESEHYDSVNAECDIQHMLTECRAHGYLLLSISETPRFLEEPGQLDVVFQVEEFQQESNCRIRTIEVRGNRSLSKAELLRDLELRKDSLLTAPALVADRERILARYHEQGLQNVRVVPVPTLWKPDTESDERAGIVDFKYEIDEGAIRP